MQGYDAWVLAYICNHQGSVHFLSFLAAVSLATAAEGKSLGSAAVVAVFSAAADLAAHAVRVGAVDEETMRNSPPWRIRIPAEVVGRLLFENRGLEKSGPAEKEAAGMEEGEDAFGLDDVTGEK